MSVRDLLPCSKTIKLCEKMVRSGIIDNNAANVVEDDGIFIKSPFQSQNNCANSIYRVTNTQRRRLSIVCQELNWKNWTLTNKNKRQIMNMLLICLILASNVLWQPIHALVVDEHTIVGLAADETNAAADYVMYNSSRSGTSRTAGIKSAGNSVAASSNTVSSNVNGVGSVGYLDNLDNLERSVAAVLIKVAYGTTSTTKRSIPDNSYVPSLTTVATPLLTTLRYLDKTSHQQQQQQVNLHHRNYELDLERDHALPTSAPNADILKSNSNPSYPNPNRHHSHDRERHRHLYNSTPMPSLPNLLKKSNPAGLQIPTVPMYPGDIPSYSPPSRSFFTPPLPPEYQNPFADKPTLRGTNSEAIAPNSGAYINRRPIPPPSLMPGHERIPFRPPDLAAPVDGSVGNSTMDIKTKQLTTATLSTLSDAERKKALNTPSRVNDASESNKFSDGNGNGNGAYPNRQDISATVNGNESNNNKRQEVLPSIRRILSGSNGKKGDVPEVLLKQVTTRPLLGFHQPPSSPVVLLEHIGNDEVQGKEFNEDFAASSSPNINKSKPQTNQYDSTDLKAGQQIKSKTSEDSAAAALPVSSTPSAAAAVGEAAATFSTTSSSSSFNIKQSAPTLPSSGSSGSSVSSGPGAAAAAAADAHTTWTIAWNIHVYLSAILFTILAVYSFYKLVTYNKLTHLFSQSYFLCIHLILISICSSRIFYLCYDAYNIHATFQIFVAELLLNLPATFLTVAFSVLILFLFLKSLNHKNNRYSALIRPLTVIVGCGVHVVLCITLHYVESYTLQNQHLYYQQQQQQQYFRRQQQQHQFVHATLSPAASLATPPTPPRVLTLICQIIYIFICLSLGLLYIYLYRILKRILRSKSQNYIHGYQNLSYAIHITIATALLFVLLAALQIFGAISLATARPMVTQGTSEIDWLQWCYQFSLRLIEIAIITLISWVTGLKVSSGGNNGSMISANGDMRLNVGTGQTADVFGNVAGVSSAGNIGNREKHNGGHSNVANFFLPCTSSSSQEQFDTDYPAICNANTNLHTYTMRTGKLIYDDSYALNSLGPTQSGTNTQSVVGGRNCAEYQMQQQPTYQRPYDTGSMQHTMSEYSAQGTLPNHRYHQLSHEHQLSHYQDYLTDATTDHYENPNFDLRGGSSSGAGSARSGGDVPLNAHHSVQKYGKASTSSTAALSSGASGSSGASQQQMLLLQSDSCYSEPLQENSSSYEFNNFERPIFGADNSSNSGGGGITQTGYVSNGVECCWSQTDKHVVNMGTNKQRERKQPHAVLLERGGGAYDNPERRSSNSTNSCTSTNIGGGGRYAANYNSFERDYYNSGVRKSGTLNNIVNNSIHGRTMTHSNVLGTGTGRASGVQTLALAERQNYQHHQRSERRSGRGTTAASAAAINDVLFNRHAHANTSDISKRQPTLAQQQNNSDEEEEDDMISGGNVECTNLITTNECGGISSTGVTNGTSATAVTGVHNNEPQQSICLSTVATPNSKSQQSLSANIHSHAMTSHAMQNNSMQQQQHSSEQEAVSSPASCNSVSGSSSTASESMLVTEQGFLRFRALDDINNAQGVGIHNAAIRKQQALRTAAAAKINSAATTNGINC